MSTVKFNLKQFVIITLITSIWIHIAEVARAMFVAFGQNFKTLFISGTTTALATIGIFWIANVNTGLGEWSTAAILFPIAWAEMIIGAWIAAKLYAKTSK